MDYKKKYEEALERAKNIRFGNTNSGTANIVCEQIFPELKERKEERIIKALIHYFSEQDGILTAIDGSVNVRDIIAWLEKQGEQNPTDKVESKFEVGDWCIDNEDNTILQITKVLSNLYYYMTNEGKEYSCTRDSIERYAHLWTIQDAKDGDVLVKDTAIIMFRKLGNDAWNDVIDYYVGYNHNSDKIVIQSGKSHYGKIDKTTFKPAAQEQRDLLFAKMKEAGYEWDAKKKELKKIEQKPDEDSCKISDDITTEEKDMNEYNKGFECGKQRVLKYPEEFNLCEKSAFAWSKEDENGLRDALWAIQQATTIAKDEGDMGNCWYAEKWLKSLKERMKGK